MTQPGIIQTILKDSNYHLDLFNTSEIQRLPQRIEGKKRPITCCPIRGKAVQLKPEELIR
jgi:type I restriction enzyme M protein